MGRTWQMDWDEAWIPGWERDEQRMGGGNAEHLGCEEGSQYRQMEGARFCSGWIAIRNPNQNTVMYCIAKFPSTTDYVHDGGPLT
jgi:hypothetical protein